MTLRFQSTPAIAGGRILPTVHVVGIAIEFQSTPAIAGGRIRVSPRRCAAGCLFQSTPAIAGGRIKASSGINPVKVVSIHARHCWRANPSVRCIQGHEHTVSIHARHCWRANPPGSMRPRWLCNRFNPRPPLLAGESAQTFYPTTARQSFNPRPPLLAGESRHCLRGVLRSSGFNPRPPLLAGESAFPQEQESASDVSIHARHCWRANPPILRWDCCRAWFQSTPAIAGGRIRPGNAASQWIDKFQSTPAIAGGRIPPMTWTTPWRACFNPRPPLLAGESDRYQVQKTTRVVSIHARHCWRANPMPLRSSSCDDLFQSTPAIAGGRIRLLDNGFRRF